MLTSIRAAAPLALGLILACAADPSSPPDHTGSITLAPWTQWSGDTVTITSDRFLDIPGTPLITVGADTLAFTQTDDTTFVVTLPQAPSGPLELVMHGIGADSLILGEVEVVGFSGVRQASSAIGGSFRPWPEPNPTGFLGRTSNYEVALLDASSGSVTRFGVPIDNFSEAPGTSYRSGIIVTTVDPQDSIGIWRLNPGGSATSIDTLELPHRNKQVYELAPWTWLVTSHHSSYIWKSDDSGLSYSVSYNPTQAQNEESPWDVIYSPDKTLAGLLLGGSKGGTPIFDLATGTLAYRIPSLLHSDGVSFTDDGELFIAGTDWNAYSVLHLESTTGAIIDSIGFPRSVATLGLVWDDRTDWVFVMANRFPDLLELQIYDRSLRPVARLVPPEEVGCIPGCFHASIVVDAGHRKVHVVRGGRSDILTFDLLIP